MYNRFQLASRFLRYWLHANNGQGHGMHSPFVFEFITRVLNDRQVYDCYGPLEALRGQLRADERILQVEDFGAGSRTGATRQRRVKEIAGSALKPRKYAQLLHRIARYYECRTVVELGTSLGLTSAYLASAPYTQQLLTLEGSAAVAEVAAANFRQLQLQNIQQVVGNFDDTLGNVLTQAGSVDLFYIDGNHRYEPTMRYFRQALPHLHEYSIVVFDDIHWSAEMEQAWQEVVEDASIPLTIDLFFIGLAFFRKDFKVKQHFAIRF